MKNSFFLILTIISVSLLSCKKEAAPKPAASPPAAKAVQAVSTVKTLTYDYQKAILVKRTIVNN